MNHKEHSPPSARLQRSDGSIPVNLPRRATVSAPKKRGVFVIIPNKIVITEGTSTAALVIDSGYSCADMKAWLTQPGGDVRQVDLPLTPLNRPGVYCFDVPDGSLGKYHVHVRNFERSLGIRSFTVSGVTAEFVYNFSNPLKIMAHALGVRSKEELDEQLSRSFASCTPRDAAHLRAAFPNDEDAPQDQGATADCEVPTLLHFACKYSLTCLLNKLTSSPGARTLCFMKNSRGETPHEIAVSAGHAEAAEIVRQLQEQQVGSEEEQEQEGEEEKEEAEEEEEGEEDDDYIVARGPAWRYVNLPGGAHQRAAGDQHPDPAQGLYVVMKARSPTKPPADQDDYSYAIPGSGVGHGRYFGDVGGDYHTIVDPPLPPSRATKNCGRTATAPTNAVRVEDLATAPFSGDAATKSTLSTAVAAVELDELGKLLQTMVENGEMTQSAAFKTYESTRVMKTKLTAEQTQQKEGNMTRDHSGRSRSTVQSLVSEHLASGDVGLDVPPPLLARSSKAEKSHRAAAGPASPKTVTSAAGAPAKMAAGVGTWTKSSTGGSFRSSASSQRSSPQSAGADFPGVFSDEPDEPFLPELPPPRRASRSRET